MRDVGPLARVQIRLRIREHGPLPFVATVCGYPVLLAELTDLLSLAPGRVSAVLAELGRAQPWPALVRGRRLITSPGPTWLLLGSQPFLGRATRREGPPFPAVGSRRSGAPPTSPEPTG